MLDDFTSPPSCMEDSPLFMDTPISSPSKPLFSPGNEQSSLETPVGQAEIIQIIKDNWEKINPSVLMMGIHMAMSSENLMNIENIMLRESVQHFGSWLHSADTAFQATYQANENKDIDDTYKALNEDEDDADEEYVGDEMDIEDLEIVSSDAEDTYVDSDENDSGHEGESDEIKDELAALKRDARKPVWMAFTQDTLTA